MTLQLITDSTQWNTTLATLPYRHILQTWDWGQFKSRWGWIPRYFLNEERTAAALLLRRTFSPLKLNILYVPKGPALDYGDAALVDRVLGELIAIARRDHALFIKIDPDLPQPDRAILLDRGWRASAEQIQFRNTMLIDLTRSEDELLAALKPKTRYNVRLAQKKGVTVRSGELSDLELLYRLYADTAQRDGFIIRPIAYYRDAWGSFIRSGLAHPLIALVDQEPVAGLILFHFADRAWYMYGMSSNLQREKMPNHLLQWEAMRWAKSQGCAVYDLWGAPDELNETDAMWGVYKFKEGLGAEFAPHVGAYDFVISPLGYWLYTQAMPRILNAMRRRHRAL
ncbi:peptidoglycan pentaglycine glycine transferase (the first glycine) [Thermoflexales bacterium]|nr:peptidoglycan pentaglycine glycine transferase (the first glycine) [Thermoflexales bacterium]